MRERLRLLLTKKKAKCKAGQVANTSSSSVPINQPVTTESASTKATSLPPPPPPPPTTTTASATSSIQSAAPPLPISTPVLSKQDSGDSLSQHSTKDPRDLEALLDFIEGRCKDAKKAAKKARQKQKKVGI